MIFPWIVVNSWQCTANQMCRLILKAATRGIPLKLKNPIPPMCWPTLWLTRHRHTTDTPPTHLVHYKFKEWSTRQPTVDRQSVNCRLTVNQRIGRRVGERVGGIRFLPLPVYHCWKLASSLQFQLSMWARVIIITYKQRNLMEAHIHIADIVLLIFILCQVKFCVFLSLHVFQFTDLLYSCHLQKEKSKPTCPLSIPNICDFALE